MARILVINPGSTSTKIALYEEEQKLMQKSIVHDLSKLNNISVQGQLENRRNQIVQVLNEEQIDLKGIDAYAARGGGLVACKGGVYEINEQLLHDASSGKGGQHPAQLASQICAEFRKQYGGRAFVVNPPDVDEFEPVSRISGIRGVYRESRIHALNQKEIALRYCEKAGRSYSDSNLIIAHLGGGISVTVHKKGKMTDSNNILYGDGPMTPTRCGSIAVQSIVELCFSGRYSKQELLDKTSKNGGLFDHLGTADLKEIEKRIRTGDAYAELVYNAMIYQIGKSIGACAAALQGRVEQIILTGGAAKSSYLVGELKKAVNWIAPISIFPGEFEMEALAAGVRRVLNGQERPLEYTGIPVWKENGV